MRKVLVAAGVLAMGSVGAAMVRSCRLNDMSDRLVQAAAEGDVNAVRRLLDEGADPSRPTSLDESTTALEAAQGNKHEDVAKLIEDRLRRQEGRPAVPP